VQARWRVKTSSEVCLVVSRAKVAIPPTRGGLALASRPRAQHPCD
jgi:hypothetical protein